jgi:hypothetical protein
LLFPAVSFFPNFVDNRAQFAGLTANMSDKSSSRIGKGQIMARSARLGTWSAVSFSALLNTVLAAPPDNPDGPVITPAPATTHYVAPLDANGYVDFHAALNLELGRGVSPTENAAIPLLQAMGPCEGKIEPINNILKAIGGTPWSPGMPEFLSQAEWMPGRIATADNQAFIDEYTQAMGIPWQKGDHPRVAAMIDANEGPLAAIALAVQKPKYYRPMLVASPDDTLIAVLLPDVQNHRDVARQLLCRAMRHLGENRPLEAQKDLLTIHRLGRTVANGCGTLIESLVGIAIDSMASHADNTWAAHPELTAEQIAAYRQQLAALPNTVNMMRCINTAERAMSMDVTQAIARGRMRTDTGGFRDLVGLASSDNTADGKWLDVGQFAHALLVMSVDWNVTMQTLNRMFDELVAAASLADRTQRLEALDGFDNQLKITKAETTSFKGFVSSVVGGSNSRGKTFGNVLGTLLMPAVKQALTAQDQSFTRTQMVQVMLALAEYQVREGEFPKTLAALSPKYLPTVPDDLMAGKPFHYTSDGGTYRLYSVGRNGQDDGGQMGTPQGADDVLMAYPPPAR